MRVLLLLNGSEGGHPGVEDGFLHLKEIGRINELRWIYFQELFKIHGNDKTLENIKEVAFEFQPNYIVIFHIAKFKISKSFITDLKCLDSKPIIVYDEGDMYGGIAKPIERNLRNIMSFVDVVSVRGLGAFSKEIRKINPNVIYTPQHASVFRYDSEPFIIEERIYPIVLIGNNAQRKILKRIISLRGSIGREKLIKHISNIFTDQFFLFGNGWSKIGSNQGPIGFRDQINIYRNSWITIAYEHYPEIPYYFSNRLPIALLAGSLYVCHYHKGYEQIFKNCDFIFFFENKEEAADIIDYILSLSKENLLGRARNARKFALKNFTPNVIWENFFNNSLSFFTEKNMGT